MDFEEQGPCLFLLHQQHGNLHHIATVPTELDTFNLELWWHRGKGVEGVAEAPSQQLVSRPGGSSGLTPGSLGLGSVCGRCSR